MKMGRLILAAVVLAALGATLYWSNKRAPVEEASKTAASESPKIISLKQEDITKLEVKKKGGDDVVVTKAGSDNWKITSPKTAAADQDPISTMVRDLSPLDADRVIDEKATDLKPYGLAEPSIEVFATGKDGKAQELLIGDDTPAGGDAYAKLENDPRVFTINSSIKTNFDKDLKDLRDKHLLPMDFEKVSNVEITGPKLHIAFSSQNGQWVTQTPNNMRADTSKFEGVFEKLKTATMDTNTSDADMKKAASAYSSGSPVGTVKVTDPSSSQELQIRKNKGDYYAKTTAMDGVFKISNDLGEAVAQNNDDFLEKRLFDFGADDPEKIEIHDGAKTDSFGRAGEDWFSNGKKLDAVSFEDFLRALRGLTATKFVSSGFSNPTMTLIVTSMSGKRIEKVQVAKSGTGYIAKREGAPELYELDAKSLDDMWKSADGVKPADQTPAAK